MLFFNSCLFCFSKFRTTIVKNLTEKPSFFIMGFKGSHEVLLRHKYDLQIFDKETTVLLKFLEICTEMRFVSLFYLNERNITASLLMTHLKKCQTLFDQL